MNGPPIAKDLILSLHIILLVYLDAFHVATLSMACLGATLQFTCFIVGIAMIMVLVMVEVTGVILKMRVVQQPCASSVKHFEFIDGFP